MSFLLIMDTSKLGMSNVQSTDIFKAEFREARYLPRKSEIVTPLMNVAGCLATMDRRSLQ